ncbi:MAG TPA: hypothetical protein VFJ22_01100, partial [Dermatophilaceae bacterium]|nr:hypothetical protein [Dermatophilaceae bacterium]
KRLGHSHGSFTAAVYSHLYDAAAQAAAESALQWALEEKAEADHREPLLHSSGAPDRATA